MISLLFAEKYSNLNNILPFQLGEGVNSIFKKVGLYLQTDSYLINNSPYTIKLARKFKLRYSTFIRWSGLVCRLIILFAYLSILMKISENKGKLFKKKKQI